MQETFNVTKERKITVPQLIGGILGAAALAAVGDYIEDGRFDLYGIVPDPNDPDGDGIPTVEELNFGLHPNKADSDNDGVPDNEEMELIQTVDENGYIFSSWAGIDSDNSKVIDALEPDVQP